MAYRVPPSRDPHLTLQPHPWGDGAAPPLAPPPIIAYLSATWKQRTVQRPQPSELLPLTLIPSRSAPLRMKKLWAPRSSSPPTRTAELLAQRRARRYTPKSCAGHER
jgi:hypothetical protein